VQDHVPEHRDEPAIAVEREALVAGPGGEAVDRRVVQTEVEDRFHHAGHRHARAGSDGHEQRSLGITEADARGVLELLEILEDLLPQPVRQPALPGVFRPGLGGDREAGRDRDSEVGHLGELAALAAEKVAHQGGAFRLAGPKK
jgi:hypothetical protein